ncbi:MAG: adenylate/guanylate cyclase domain-containing protein [Acidimicrobiia bacterium]
MPGAGGLPTGTVTFLFTDLEGSTRLWEEHPEAMKDALARHDELLRSAVESHGGHVVKTTGDGLHAVFATAEQAVAAAVAGQGALSGVDGPEGPLRVRMGLHTGAADVRDGDYYGGAVNRAARVSAAGHGGQVLVSHATEELIRDDLGDGLALVDLGEHRLRDLARPERLFQLAAPGMPREFPPVRSVDAFPGNLPSQLTSFVGRDDELSRVGKALDESRLVTLIGVGGVGKTRLATQVAAEVLPRFADGAWLCELAAASDAEAMVQVVAATLGVQQHPNVSLEESILEYLRTKQLLLVLDNCEHLLADAGGLAEGVLHRSDGVRILATSREGLAVEGEQVWPLRSLRTPTSTSTVEVVASAAARLFIERAQAAAPGFDVDDANAAAVAEICKRLDGIPLAIELAAARVSAMSPTEIAALLDERFRLLTGGRRTAVERHQTLRATVDWSYSLLEPNERFVFDRLGVFSGSFDNAAASAVVTGDGIEHWDVVDAMAGLVNKSMVNAEKTSEDTTRYTMLETLRQYAREQLDEHDASDDWRRRHAQHYAALAEQAGRELVGRRELAARRRVQTELDNLRAAVTWALDSTLDEDVELGVGIVAELSYEATCNVASGIGAWAERAVEAARRSTSERRRAVLGAAAYYLHQGLGDFPRARQLALEAVEEGFVADAPGGSIAETTLGMSYMAAGERELMLEVIANIHRRLDEGGEDLFVRSALHSSTAAMLTTIGDWNMARVEASAGLATARQIQNPTCLALALFAVGWTNSGDDPGAALAAYEESIALTRAGAVDGAFGAALSQAAQLRAHAGDARGSLEGLREAITYSHEVGDHMNFINAVNRGIQIVGLLGNPVAAATLSGVMKGDLLEAFPVYELRDFEGRGQQAVQDQVRSELGDDVYSAAMARGTAMSYDEIVAYVLAEIDRMLAELDDA